MSPPSYVQADSAGTYFLDATHAWIAEWSGSGSNRSIITFRTADGGKTWGQGTPFSTTGINLSPALYFLDHTHGWALLEGDYSDDGVGMPDFLYSTSDGGLHWARVTTNPRGDPSKTCQWNNVAFISSTNGWISEYCGSGSIVLIATHDGGLTWVPQQLPVAGAGINCPCTADVPVVFDQDNASLLFSGSGAKHGLLFTYDGGKSWKASMLPGEWQQAVTFVDAEHGWTVAGPSALFGKNSKGQFPSEPGVVVPLYHTDDGGQSWMPVPTSLPLDSAQGRIFDVYFVDLENGFADRFSVATQKGQVLKTADGGRTWTVVGPSSTVNGPSAG